jgi:hypothetical protein
MLDRRTDGNLGLAWEHLHHGLCHHVRSRVPQGVQLIFRVVFFLISSHGSYLLIA